MEIADMTLHATTPALRAELTAQMVDVRSIVAKLGVACMS
jgi:hypothetical protein